MHTFCWHAWSSKLASRFQQIIRSEFYLRCIIELNHVPHDVSHPLNGRVHLLHFLAAASIWTRKEQISIGRGDLERERNGTKTRARELERKREGEKEKERERKLNGPVNQGKKRKPGSK